jgi:hypothetical protein
LVKHRVSIKKLDTYGPGVSILAILYILAQFDERLIDPFSNTKHFGHLDQDGAGHKAAGHKAAGDSAGDRTNSDADKYKQARIASMWCLASDVGVILCYLTVGLLQVTGILSTPSSNLGHLGDAILSGITIGAGTKPLHDLINLFDNSSNPKSGR